MAATSSSNPAQNTYKDGKITQGFITKGFSIPGVPKSGGDTRTFVSGEKFWATRIDIKNDGVVFELFSDPISDVRYRATLKIAFPKGAMPSADVVEKKVSEVFKVQPAENSSGNTAQQSPQNPHAPPSQRTPAPPVRPDAPLEEIAPPPPPSDEPPAPPKSVSIGQTQDQVIAALGQPERIVHLGSKDIYYFKNLKVTLVSGKVTDAQ